MDASRILKLTVAVAVLGTVLFSGACSEDSNELQRLVCEVQSINGGLPLISGYYDAGQDRRIGTEDDTLPIDTLPITFHARPYNEAITLPDDAPFSYFHITSYDLQWVPISPGSEELVDFGYQGAGVDCLVPVGDEATVSVLVADRYLKEQPFFPRAEATLPLTARGVLTFHGHETGSDEEVTLTGSFMANFVWAVIGE